MKTWTITFDDGQNAETIEVTKEGLAGWLQASSVSVLADRWTTADVTISQAPPAVCDRCGQTTEE